ncbi:MFS transporter [Nonomuraea pusilla]|uniref:Predicted arabinose efflux permease, MFS family n=1 Tax=Nonomuraea pusilla TaxID=46177 RepID=A0A1H7WCC7_9ACTN|nr:MFS transporter [Nonomuraea pusilla]SEM19161.1 Predicted arabinose efflux permease, MFS family [Nonomuraea pusilla]
MTAPKALDTPHDVPGILGPAHRTATLGILLVVTLIAFEGMSVSVVMTAVSHDLDALDLYGLSFSAFLIASLFANVVSGLWSDRRGYQAPFLVGVLLFAVGMALAGAAQTKELFLAARAVQGLGAGTSVVALYVMIARVYPVAMRPKAFAAVSAAWVVPAMVGPAVAGFVADQWGWRFVFYGIIPLVVPALVMLVPALRHPAEEAQPPSGGPRSRPVAMTLAATAAAGGAGLMLFEVDRLHVAPLPSALLAVAGLAFLAYGLHRLLPPRALRLGRGLPTTVMLRGFFSAAFFGVNAFIPLALQQVKQFDTTTAGIALTTGALGWSAGSYLQSRRTADPHRMMRIGASCVTAGIVLSALSVLPGMTGWVAVPAWIVAGLGMGLGMTTVSVTALKQSPLNEQGANSAALSVTDMLGSGTALGVAGALVNVIGHSPEQIATGFCVISLLMAAIGLATAVLAGRTRPLSA